MKIIVLLLFTINTFSQSGKLTLIADGETTTYRLKDCYKRTRTAGEKFKVVVWGPAVHWDKSKYLVIKSFCGKYSTNKKIYNLTDNVVIDFDNPDNKKVKTRELPVNLIDKI